MTKQELAQALNNGLTQGQVIGKGSRNYTLWEFTVNGYKIYYKFAKMLSSSRTTVETLYPGVLICEGLESNWHTQANLTAEINDLRIKLSKEVAEAAYVMPFGKHKGQRLDEMTDLDYLCWLCNQCTKEEGDKDGIDEWIRTAARKRATELYAIQIGGYYIDPNGISPFNKNTMLIYMAINNHLPIEYFATGNDGSIWSAYNINLPTVAVGHPYYGVCNCLKINGQARKAKGMLITIYEYEVDGANITVKQFSANRF